MELDVFHLDRLASGGPACRLKHDFIVQPETELRHATQIALHLNRAQDLRSKNISVRGNKEVQGLDHVEEYFVLAVADSFASPRDGVCDSDRWSCLDFQFVRLLCDIPAK